MVRQRSSSSRSLVDELTSPELVALGKHVTRTSPALGARYERARTRAVEVRSGMVDVSVQSLAAIRAELERRARPN